MKNDKSKLYQIWFTRIAGIVGAIFIFCGICKALNYMYVDIDADAWGRILWHHFYQSKGKIENIYVGSSHVYCGINPLQLDSINNSYNFNMASSSQTLDSSYFLLKEADRLNPLTHVYLELYYDISTKNNDNSETDPIDIWVGMNWNNTDHMDISYNKIAYMLSTNDIEKYVDMLLPFSRYRTKLNDWEYVKRTISGKQTEEYLTYQKQYELLDGNGYDEYLDRGYCYSTGTFSNHARSFEQRKILYENSFGYKSDKYLRKIIEYCQKRNLPITLFITPIMELQLVSTQNYDNYINEVKTIAAEYDIAFYDFNLAKKEYLPIQHGKYFRDAGHLNYVGADLFTPFFSKIVSGSKKENEVYFYQSYSEKLALQSPELYGIYYRYPNDEDLFPEDVRIFSIASNRESGMEYRIIMTPDEDEQYLIQDFAENKIFTVPISEHGICTIIARVKEFPDEMQTLEIDY